ncbi:MULTISPECIES: ABC transporter substrate-binding protein [unclassified Lysinibacillus]|uniref:ABC transporter substrate-binding protein n=1 Tax=unclassified Lysinibacillus TaxID=2636778 RepID=UPI00255326CD|nr:MULTISPECIES: ABC transporter substrate-binding protein [unclassified Lysinibacillus]MDM5248089.1 ABC transporter substrate-binding protein [Lysinibacillus sp. G4S2]
MKKTVLSLFLLMGALLMVACSSSSDSGKGDASSASSGTETSSDSIKMAGIFSASGGAAALGESEMQTLKMLVDQKNADGGINGRKIDLVTYDDKSDQNEAILAMKKALTQDKVSIVIGGTTSGNSLAMLPLAEQNQVPYISVAASKQIYMTEDGQARKWVFKMPQDDQQAVERILQYLKDNNLTKVAWLNVANSYGTGGHEEFVKHAADYGVESVIEDEFEATVKDAKPLLTRVKKENPDAIIVWGTVQESAVVIKNIRELALDIPVLASHGVATDQFIEVAGDAANDVVLPTGKLLVADKLEDSNPQKELLKAYNEAFTAKYNKPASTFGAYAADAFAIATKAIEAKGSDSAALRDYIEQELGEYVGLTGVFNITADNHMGLSPDSFAMVRIVDGKWTLEDK